MVIKAVAAVAGLSVFGVGGIILAKPGWMGMMPHYTKLSDDHDFGSGENVKYKSKFGETYKDKLVGVVGNKSGEEGNKEWWEWSFKRLQAEEVDSGAFAVKGNNKKVGSAYGPSTTTGDTNPKALNRVCEDVYKSEASNITTDGNGENKYKEEDVWKYCSWLGKKPKQVATAGSVT